MRKIVCVHGLTEEQANKVRQAAPDFELVFGKEKELWLPHLKDAEVLVGWDSAAADEVLQPDSKLRWVQNWGAGVDRFPLDRLAAAGVDLTTASGVHAYPIAETVFAMMLSLTRKLHASIRFQLQKKWENPGSLGEIHEKTIGIIGVGAIGEEVARLAKAFRMTVLGLRRSGEPSAWVDRMYGAGGLAEVLGESDFVVVTVPSTDETRHMFGREQFAQMKCSAVFINIGRGATTDTEALIEALRRGEIGGAGLDVFEEEPLPDSSPLWEMDNVIMTPHNSGATVHYHERAFDIFMQNLQDYIKGRKPSLNRVDYARQY
ncbi:D-2-hydroxyacid dehydrogenase [Paenibacillus hamazuiensis]|uniref:D-2-hydroxyacid dehydrogenase n=1 Tax=Paenibacillus hamazuiensis TaxID=2936508 RepID=UPI00200CD45E|nr:D-2-hydroxyacid dehydrogenase [Paenibacillus hamazuiensis]